MSDELGQGEQGRLHAMLAPGVEAQGCELLGVQLSRGRRRSVLRLFIDRAEGITLEDCERVSHQVSGLLDVEDPIGGEYDLEVSSPGDDRPLFRREHFERFVGHPVRLRLHVPRDGQRNVTGELIAVSDTDEVSVRVSGREDEDDWVVPMADIASARLVPAASAPGAKTRPRRR